MLKRFALASIGVIAALTPAIASAQISASATVTAQQLSPTSYQYSLTLTNTGSTNIASLWFGWIPAYDLLTSATTDFTSPSGWTGFDAPDVFGTNSAQWTTTTAPLTPGNSLSGFSFTSAESPAQITGVSPFFGLPQNETYVYIGAPETDPGFAFTPSVVVTPEPTSVAIILGLPMLLLRRRR